MARFRRRRSKGKWTWLPTWGQYDSTQPFAFQDYTLELDLTGTTAGQSVGAISVVVRDEPQEFKTTDETSLQPGGIGEIINNEYVLKRIVGKINCHLYGSPEGTDAASLYDLNLPPFVVTSGFFVARADHVNDFLPVGSATEEELYNPQALDTVRQPWIWRRTWILGWGDVGPKSYGYTTNPVANNGLTANQYSWGNAFPRANWQYGSAFDGPHCDAKTGRRVRQQERLFFATFAHTYPTGWDWTNIGTQVSLGINVDVRVLGGLRKPINRSNF